MRSIIEKMRPFDAHQKALQVREKCGIDFYQEHYHDFIDIPCPACGRGGRMNLLNMVFITKGAKNA